MFYVKSGYWMLKNLVIGCLTFSIVDPKQCDVHVEAKAHISFVVRLLLLLIMVSKYYLT